MCWETKMFYSVNFKLVDTCTISQILSTQVEKLPTNLKKKKKKLVIPVGSFPPSIPDYMVQQVIIVRSVLQITPPFQLKQ